MSELGIVVSLGCTAIAWVIHNGLYELRMEVKASRQTLGQIRQNSDHLIAALQRIEIEAMREIHTQQEIRDYNENRRRMEISRQVAEGIAKGTARIFEG